MKNRIKNAYSFCSYHFPLLSRVIESSCLKIDDFTANKKEYNKRVNNGKSIFDKIIKNEKYFYVFIDKGIGDFLMVASLAYIYEKKYNKPIAFVVLKKQQDLTKLFSYIKKTIGLDSNDFQDLLFYFDSRNYYESTKHKYAFFKMPINKNGRRNWSKAHWDKKKFLSKRYKESVFNDAKLDFMRPVPPTISEKLKKKHRVGNNAVVLMPMANTVTTVNSVFWINLAQELIKKGFQVFTNIGNPSKEKPIDGTESLCVSLLDLYSLSPLIKSFVSLRSGICELLAFADANIVVINKKNNYDMWDDVSVFSKNGQVFNIDFDDNYDIIIKKVCKVIGEK